MMKTSAVTKIAGVSLAALVFAVSAGAEAPVADTPAAVDTLAAAEARVMVDTPPAADRPPAADNRPPTADAPPAADNRPPTADAPPAADRPPAADAPSAADNRPPTADAPSAADNRPSAADAPSAANAPPAVDRPASAGRPPVAETLDIVDMTATLPENYYPPAPPAPPAPLAPAAAPPRAAAFAAPQKRMMNGVVYTLEDSLKSVEQYASGNAHYGRRDFSGAIAEYSKAIELMPFTVQYRYARGAAFASNREFENAIEDFSDLIEMRPDEASYRGARGGVYNLMEEYGRAVEDLSDAIEMDPKNVNCLYNRGFAYFHLKDYENSIADVRAALRIAPGNAEAQNLLTLIKQARENDPASAAKKKKSAARGPIFSMDAYYGYMSSICTKGGQDEIKGHVYGGSFTGFIRSQSLNKLGFAAGIRSAQCIIDYDGLVILSMTSVTACLSPIYRIGLRNYYFEAALTADIPVANTDEIEIQGFGTFPLSDLGFETETKIAYSANFTFRAAFISAGAGMALNSDDAMMQLYASLHIPLIKKYLEIVPSFLYYYTAAAAAPGSSPNQQFVLSIGTSLSF